LNAGGAAGLVGRLARPPAVWVIFGWYAGFLFMLTHWPRLTIPLPGRPDLLVHASIFAVWTCLLIACGLFGPALSIRNIGRSFPVALAYSAIDEGLQAIPFIRRNAAWDDWACNATGVAAACLAALLIGTVAARGSAGRGPRIG